LIKIKKTRRVLTIAGAFIPLLTSQTAFAQNVDVRAQVRLLPAKTETAVHGSHSMPPAAPASVIWLTPLEAKTIPAARSGPYILAQKNKQFLPHLLVVPVGSTVQFPNQDPYFHNVFSLFNGRRFDLGLYEAGSTRSVRFSREGVSYVFCNIHPEMSAVILALATPYFAVIEKQESTAIRDVPPGQYRLHVWSEGAALERLDALVRVVDVANGNSDLGLIEIPLSGDLSAHHKNKFGNDYDDKSPPIY
jgi:plastocyanin